MWLTQWLAFRQSYGSGWSKGPSGLLTADAQADTYGQTWSPSAFEPAACPWVMRRPLHDWGLDSADRSLHTAGPDNPDDCCIRLDLLGPAAIDWLGSLQEQGEHLES